MANSGRVEIAERACGCWRRVCLWLWSDAIPDIVSLHTQTPGKRDLQISLEIDSEQAVMVQSADLFFFLLRLL